MELSAQPICLPICMNAYFFHGPFVLHLQTGIVNRLAISSGAFAVFPLEIHWIQSWTPPPCLWNSKLHYPPTSSEFQSKKPPLSIGIPRCRPWYGYFLESPNPKPKDTLSDLVKLWRQANEKEDALKRNVEHWHRAHTTALARNMGSTGTRVHYANDTEMRRKQVTLLNLEE